MLTYGRYRDGPRPQPPLAARCDLNPKGAKRGLYPTQPAGECARTLRPARAGPSGHSIAANIDADLQKVGCTSRPLRSVRHDLADNGRMGRLDGSRQMDLRQARRVPRQCPSASNQDGKAWQLGLVPAEPAPSTRLNLSVPTRRRHPATAKDRCFHSCTQTKRILAFPVLRV